MASRSQEKADAAIKHLKELTGKEAIFLELDLSSLASVRKAADEFMRFVLVLTKFKNLRLTSFANCGLYSKEKELHTLFNNALVLFSPISVIV